MHPLGHRDAVAALGMSTPPEGLQCRVPLADVGPCWPITALRCVEAVAQEGAEQSGAPCLVPALTDALTGLLWGFISPETRLVSLCSGVGEHSPSCQGLACVAQLGPPEKRTHKEWFSCLCPEVPFAFVDRGVVSDRNRL